MKKILSLLLLLAVTISMSAQKPALIKGDDTPTPPASTTQGTTRTTRTTNTPTRDPLLNQFRFKIISSTKVRIVEYLGDYEELVIPSKVKIDGVVYTVSEIGGGAFAKHWNLHVLTIPSCISAFYYNRNLGLNISRINYEGTVVDWYKICKSEFEVNELYIQGHLLTHLKQSDVEKIPTWGVFHSKNIKRIDLPKNFHFQLYSQTTRHLKEVHYEGSLTDWCKVSDKRLWSIVDSFYVSSDRLLTEIKPQDSFVPSASCFHGILSLRRIALQEGITEIPDSCFWNCSNLYEVTFPKSLQTIHKSAFENCGSLQRVLFQEGLRVIGVDVFKDCKSLCSINLPVSLAEINGGAFKACSLTHITIPQNVKWLVTSCFDGCNLKTITWDARQAQLTGSLNATRVTFGEHVMEVPDSMLYRASTTRVDLSESIRTIGNSAFERSQIERVTIPNGVQRIMFKAFSGCEKIKEIIISKSVIYVSNGAFYSCRNLKKVVWNAQRCLFSIDFENPECRYYNVPSHNHPFCDTYIELLEIGPDVQQLPSYFCLVMRNLKEFHWNAIQCDDHEYNRCPFYIVNDRLSQTFVYINIQIGESVTRLPDFLFTESIRPKVGYGLIIPNSVKEIGNWSLPNWKDVIVVFQGRVEKFGSNYKLMVQCKKEDRKYYKKNLKKSKIKSYFIG